MPDPGSRKQRPADYLHHVEPERGRLFLQPSQVAQGRPAQGVPLAPVHGAEGTAEFLAAAGFHFNENERLPVADQEVDFVARIQADTAARTARAELWRYVPASRLLAGTSSTSSP